MQIVMPTFYKLATRLQQTRAVIIALIRNRPEAGDESFLAATL